MSDLRWHFPVLDGGIEDSFNDPLQEYFQGDHEYFIARETIQNALDARDDSGKPVQVQFEVINFPSSKLPGASDLLKIFDACIAFDPGNKKANEFFGKAKTLLQNDYLKVLRIGDYRTWGLDGSDDNKSGRWHKLVKSVGKNEASGVAGGAFGIGKGAPFAASQLRYVLYSTRSKDGVAFQGNTRLVSHEFGDAARRGIGSWGEEGRRAIRSEADIPSEFIRSEKGTDVYIPGYKYTSQWMDKLISSVLKNFWAAIYFDDLEVKFVEGSKKVEIRSDNLSTYLENYQAEKQKENPLFFYRAVNDSQTKRFEKNHRIIGPARLYVLVEEGLPKSVQFMRLPKMVVRTTSPRVLSDDFSAVFLLDPKNTKGNETLKNLEPPKHDDWDPALGSDYGINGNAVLKEIEGWVKECLQSLEVKDDSAANEIPGLNRLLPETELEEGELASYTGDDDIDIEPGGEESSREKTIILDGSKKEKTKPIQLTPVSVGGGNNRVPEEGSGSGEDDGSGAGDDVGNTLRMDTSNIRTRAYPVGDPINGMYVVILASTSNTNGDIKIIVSGDDKDYPVDIESARTFSNEIVISDGPYLRSLSISANKPLRMRLTLREKHSFAYSLGVENYVQ